jgi:hypothetical protein
MLNHRTISFFIFSALIVSISLGFSYSQSNKSNALKSEFSCESIETKLSGPNPILELIFFHLEKNDNKIFNANLSSLFNAGSIPIYNQHTGHYHHSTLSPPA